jgi:DNA-binding XRE family transcriptional regulator
MTVQELRTLPANHAYLQQVGMRIKVQRARRWISQDTLAALSSISRVTLGSIERGEHSATLLTYVTIADALGIDVGDLLTTRTD